MPCDDDDHVFYAGTHAEVRRVADRPGSKSQVRHLWPCAWCHEQVDLLAVELTRREAEGGPY